MTACHMRRLGAHLQEYASTCEIPYQKGDRALFCEEVVVLPDSIFERQIVRAGLLGCGWESLMKNVTLGNVTMSHRTRERPAECLASLSHSTMIGLLRAQH
ncbi:hypothetical protein EVAR_101763_1 [Eumeta japonica]|uniref:Uncharacterized protein n=1 Tax=Eumeta variegata TaxID=151549 RepID=A0A4C1SN12_EUMVA|nr:hypothetical protein EVAR_101763_1 [Eumeta japonica]